MDMTREETITRVLERQGWRRQFVASEPRLSEAVETYRELGFEVHLEPFPKGESASDEQMHGAQRKCRACFEGSEDHYSIIFTKPAADGGNTPEENRSDP